MKQWKLKTTLGPIYLVATTEALIGLYWKEQSVPMAETLNANAAETKILARAAREVCEFLAGKRVAFTLPLKMQGTEFQEKVWSALREIPYGQTISYGELARRIGKPAAVRAVGTANGRNPISLLVPCHRVINASGKLGGYAGGVGTKIKLLEIESGRI